MSSVSWSTMQLTTTQRPFFRYGNPTTLGTSILNFATKYAEANIGATYGYNNTTGKFTVPYTGVWFFMHNIYGGGNFRFNTSSGTKTSIYGNAANTDTCGTNATTSAQESNSIYLFTVQTQSEYLTTYLTVGDAVWVEKTAGNDTGDATACYFAGIFLG